MQDATKLDASAIAKLLQDASDSYYNTGVQLMPDAEFDGYKAQLKKLDPNHAFLKQVGAGVVAHLEEVKLKCHMGSQLHATTDEEFWSWYEKNGSPEVIVTDKVDGSSVEIWYQNGRLKRVATRGDGDKGNDITANARYWGNIPKTINAKGDVVVRCEAILLIDLWKKHFADKTNPRAAGNGAIMRKSEPEGNKYMNAFAFDITCDVKFTTQRQKIKLLQALGFQTVRYFVARDRKQLESCWKKYNEQRLSLPYEIDGVVVCIDDLATQQKLGFTDNRPKGQTAWKFPPLKVRTIVRGMTITMGHTGAIIPTLKLQPVECGGVTISNVLLTTWDRSDTIGANVDDEVEIARAGDVIPYINKVTKKNSVGAYPRPTHCFECKTELEAQGAYLVCPNHEDCPGQIYGKVRNWLDKTGVKQVGDGLLEALFDAKLVKAPHDVYSLTADQMEDLPLGAGVVGRKRAETAVAEIDKVRELDIHAFMGSIGIKGLGRRQAEIMGLKTIDEFIYLTEPAACGLPGIGPSKASIIVESIQANLSHITRLRKVVTIKDADDGMTMAAPDGKLNGMTFCFTGCRMTADEKLRMVYLGGMEKTSVSKGLTYLVCKDPAVPSSKNQKAVAAGVQLMSYDAFQKLIAE